MKNLRIDSHSYKKCKPINLYSSYHLSLPLRVSSTLEFYIYIYIYKMKISTCTKETISVSESWWRIKIAIINPLQQPDYGILT